MPAEPRDEFPDELLEWYDENGRHELSWHEEKRSALQGNEPGPTITTQFYNYGSGRFGHYEPAQNRALSIREGAMLQTFPEDYEFLPSDNIEDIGFQRLGRWIGNAVPPKLAEVIGASIIRYINGYRQMTVGDFN